MRKAHNWSICLVLALMVSMALTQVASAKTVIKIWTPHDFDVRYQDVHKELWQPFEDENPDIEIQWTRVPDWEQKFRISAAAGQLPDIFAVDGINVPAYAERGLLEPLDRWITSDIRDDYFDSAKMEMVWKDKVYALGLETNAHLMFYNPELLQRYGYNEPATYWEDLQAMAKKLTIDVDGDGRLDQWAAETWFGRNEGAMYMLSAFIWQNGGSIIDPETGEVVVNQPKTVEAAQWLNDAVNKWGVFPKAGAVQAGPEGGFIGGKIAMSWSGPFNFGFYETQYPDFKWEVAPTPYPMNGKRVAGIGGWHFSMFSKSKNKPEAGKVMQYIASEAFTEKLAESYGMPVRKAVAEKWGIHEKYPWTVVIDQIAYGRPRPRHPEYPAITDAVTEAFDKAIFGGMDTQQAFDEAARKIKAAVAK